MDIQASIVINWPAEAAFAYLASEEHIAVLGQRAESGQEANEDDSKCRPYNNIPVMINPLRAQFQEMRRASEGEPGRGSAFAQVYTQGDRTFETSVVISVYEPPRTLAFTISGQPFLPRNREDQTLHIPAGFVFNREPIWLSYILIPLVNGTRLTCTIGIVDTRGDFYRLLNELFFTKALDKALKEDLGRLKELLESRPVPLTSETLQEGAERVTRRFLGIFPYKEVHQHPVVKEIHQEPEDLAW